MGLTYLLRRYSIQYIHEHEQIIKKNNFTNTNPPAVTECMSELISECMSS